MAARSAALDARTRDGSAGPDVWPLTRVTIGGMACDLVERADAEVLLREAVAGRMRFPLLLASVNLQKVFQFGRGRPAEGFFDRARHGERWLALVDGAPVAAQARRLTGRVWPRLAGSDLLPWMLDAAAEAGARVGFVGGQESTHERFRRLQPHRWPDLQVSGAWPVPAAEIVAQSSAIAREVAASRTDVLFAALTPHGEAWLDEWVDDSGVRVGAAFGAALEMLVGERRRSPIWMRRLGLEWLWRFVHEPRRLGRRYLLDGPRAYALVRRASSRGPGAHVVTR